MPNLPAAAVRPLLACIALLVRLPAAPAGAAAGRFDISAT